MQEQLEFAMTVVLCHGSKTIVCKAEHRQQTLASSPVQEW